MELLPRRRLCAPSTLSANRSRMAEPFGNRRIRFTPEPEGKDYAGIGKRSEGQVDRGNARGESRRASLRGQRDPSDQKISIRAGRDLRNQRSEVGRVGKFFGRSFEDT